ncbi:MAG TPA: hypothetical protein VF150_00250 [Thermoanaerobaculia bacterium]
MKKNHWTMITAVALTFLVAAPALLAQGPAATYEGRLPSAYGARTLPALEIDADFYQPGVARERLARALAEMAGPELPPLAAQALRQATPDERTLWTGSSPADPGLEFAFDRTAGRLEVVQTRLQGVRPWERTGPTVSRAEALARAKDFIHTLHRARVLDRRDFDLDDLEVTVQRTGLGARGAPTASALEWVDQYRIAARRVVNGLPVVGSGVRVVIDASGAVSEVSLAYRQLQGARGGGKADPAGRGQEVAVTRTPEDAKARFEAALGLPSGTRVHVERWGLAYLDTGEASQAFYQPVYVFAATPLTETETGTIAGRQVVRVVPASTTTLEEISFDPFENAPPGSGGGDPRPGA